MKKKLFLLSMVITGLIYVNSSCKKSSTPTPTPNPCTSTNIVITETVTDYTSCPTVVTGSITVTASGSSGYTYNKNGGSYQSSNLFTGLTAGTYTIGVKDANGCTNTKSVTVGETAGVNFKNVRTIIRNNCGGNNCHLNGQSQRGYNFDDECDIVNSWNMINNTTVIQQSMPTSGPLSASDRQAITNWVNAGHGYNN